VYNVEVRGRAKEKERVQNFTYFGGNTEHLFSFSGKVALKSIPKSKVRQPK